MGLKNFTLFFNSVLIFLETSFALKQKLAGLWSVFSVTNFQILKHLLPNKSGDT